MGLFKKLFSKPPSYESNKPKIAGIRPIASSEPFLPNDPETAARVMLATTLKVTKELLSSHMPKNVELLFDHLGYMYAWFAVINRILAFSTEQTETSITQLLESTYTDIYDADLANRFVEFRSMQIQKISAEIEGYPITPSQNRGDLFLHQMPPALVWTLCGIASNKLKQYGYTAEPEDVFDAFTNYVLVLVDM